MKIFNHKKGVLTLSKKSLCDSISNIFNFKSLLLGVLITSFSVNAQNKPYPQQNNWANCIKPNISQSEMDADVAAFYDLWKSLYMKETDMSGGYYVHGECTNCTEPTKGTSEGHGWGMLITVLMAGYDGDAKTYFDGFYDYFDQHRSPFNDELMSWMVEYSENGGEATATDGDLDIAYALLLAHDQWGSNGDINYLQEAKDMITSGLKVSDMNQSTQRVMLGTWDTDGDSTRSSDWMTAQFRAYGAATDDSFWDGAIDTAYGIMNTIQSNYSTNTGLMPDFVVDSSPKPADAFFLESENDGAYNWNACRFPWRVAMDYAHYGNEESKTVVNKIVNWAKIETGGDPTSFKAGYTLDGSALAEYSSTAFTAPLLVASIVDSDHQSFLNSGWEFIKDSNYSYYDASINLLSMLVISGNWWVPQEEGTIVVIPVEDQTAYVSHSIPGIIEAEDFDNGGQGVAYNDTTTINSGGDSRTNESVDVQNTSVEENGVAVGWTADGEWLEYTIGSVTSGVYDINLRVASDKTSTKSISLSLDGAELGSASVLYTGGWQDWDTLTLSNVQITGGTNKILRMSISGGNYNVNYMSFSISGDEGEDDSLTVSSLSSFNATASSQTISVNSNVDWTVSENSSWISVNTSGGSNNGTVQVSVSENTATSSRSATITISGGGIQRSVTVFQAAADDNNTSDCGGVPTWDAGTAYSEKGTQVVFGNNIYENKWYSLNENPADNSVTSWSVWTLIGLCDSSAKSLGEIDTNALGVNSFPNPFTNQINVSSSDVIQTIGSLRLLDLSGSIIAKQTGASLNSIEGIANGMYLLQVLNVNGHVISVQKVIKK